VKPVSKLIRFVIFLSVVTFYPLELEAQETASEWEEEGAISGERISLQGYGELHYNNPKTGATVPSDDDPAQMDFHRMVIGVSYQFSDRVILHTEVDFEHAASEMELEFAHIDFLVSEELNFRAGSVLMPVGPLNEFHEPPLFYSVERPYVQTYIIPTSWQEGGAGIFGSLQNKAQYRIYAVSGLNAGGFSGSKGIRGGRGKVAKSPSDDLALVGRMQYTGVPGFDAGFSFYWGGAGQSDSTLEGAAVRILESDVRFRRKGFDLKAVFVHVDVSKADRISDSTGQTVGETLLGWYVEGAYNLLNLLSSPVDQSAVVFIRFESFDTHHRVPIGFAADPSNNRDVITGGIAYYPHLDVAIKADFERWEDAENTTETRLNLATTYRF